MRDRRQMRAVSSLLFSILVVLMLVLGFSSTYSLQPALQPAQPPAYPSTLGSFGTATVDAVLSPGEYGSCIGPVTLPKSLAGTQYTIIFCETNDATNDYYYFEINDLKLNGYDFFFLLFDNNNDDLIPACGAGLPVEDAIGAQASVALMGDEHYCGLPTGPLGPLGPLPPVKVDSVQNIFGVKSFTPGVGYRFEFSHPLNSGDSQDYALSIGSTVGWCIYYRDDDKPPPNILDYPPECYYRYNATGKADLFGHVIKMGNQTMCPTVTTTVTTTTTITTTRPTTIINTTTVTTTATTTTTQISTVTSATTKTTTSIVIDPMLEIKLDILIGLVITIIGLIIWLYLKCCKKKVPGPPLPPTPPPEPPPPQPPQPSSGKPPP